VARSPTRKRIVLSYELAELADACQAARILSEAIETRQLGSDYDQRQAPRALTAILSITWARLKDLTRVSRGDLDPVRIHAPHNDAGSSSFQDEIVLTEWDARRKGAR